MAAPTLPRVDRRPRVGLVLGAGGIRGCAHAGVAGVLHEEGVPIDVVVGTSVGAMIGLAVAAQLPVEQIRQVVRETTPLDLIRFYAGRLRAGRSNPIARMMYEAGDGKEFSDLALPFAVTVTDMEHDRPVVIDSGPVLPAVEASAAVPFIARPAELGGRMYLDGGLLDTLPVYVARALGAELVIGVCLGVNYTSPRFLRKHPWAQKALARLGRQYGPSSARFRDQLRFGCRLFAAGCNPPPPSADADVTIEPDFGRLSPNSPFGAQFALAQGERAARAALPLIRAGLKGEPAWTNA